MFVSYMPSAILWLNLVFLTRKLNIQFSFLVRWRTEATEFLYEIWGFHGSKDLVSGFPVLV
jgi:hypothetical protein